MGKDKAFAATEIDFEAVGRILDSIRKMAVEYREQTGKPLGISGEVGEYEAARLLNLKLAQARTSGYDAVRESDGRKYQIKTRCVHASAATGQRLGRIRRDQADFDAVLLVLLDSDYQPISIHEAPRDAVLDRLSVPGSRARNERGALSVQGFISISNEVWPCSRPQAGGMRTH